MKKSVVEDRSEDVTEQIGLALSEQLPIRRGKCLNPNYSNAKPSPDISDRGYVIT